MRYLDERPLWNSETDALAEKLANKSKRELQEIFEECDVISLRSTNRPENSTLNRLFFVLLWVPFVLLACVKWCFTGQFYLDSWVQKSKVLAFLIRSVGLK